MKEEWLEIHNNDAGRIVVLHPSQEWMRKHWEGHGYIVVINEKLSEVRIDLGDKSGEAGG